MEYPLAGNNSFIVGIGFEKNLFDITRDNGDQPSNVVTSEIVIIPDRDDLLSNYLD